jgi:hypothetical protein
MRQAQAHQAIVAHQVVVVLVLLVVTPHQLMALLVV